MNRLTPIVRRGSRNYTYSNRFTPGLGYLRSTGGAGGRQP